MSTIILTHISARRIIAKIAFSIILGFLLISLIANVIFCKSSEMEANLREELAKVCFETLLQFSLLEGLDQDGNLMSIGAGSAVGSPNEILKEGEGLAGRLAVTALLHRFQQVLQQYVLDENRSGKCPLPRYRLSEISFVLKAVATLVISLKKSPEKVNLTVWDQLISLYPYLVDCTSTTSAQVSDSLREALMQYCDLLKPPTVSNTISNGV